VDNLALVLITGDIGWRIRWGLRLQLMNEVGDRCRHWRRIRARPEAAAGRQCRGHDQKQPGLHRHETTDRTGDCGPAQEIGIIGALLSRRSSASASPWLNLSGWRVRR